MPTLILPLLPPCYLRVRLCMTRALVFGPYWVCTRWIPRWITTTLVLALDPNPKPRKTLPVTLTVAPALPLAIALVNQLQLPNPFPNPNPGPNPNPLTRNNHSGCAAFMHTTRRYPRFSAHSDGLSRQYNSLTHTRPTTGQGLVTLTITPSDSGTSPRTLVILYPARVAPP